MTKKQAIKSIETQRSKISEYGDNYIWTTVTLSYFKDIFGKDSGEYKLLKSFEYGMKKPEQWDARGQIEWGKTIDRLDKLLLEAIELIKIRGVANNSNASIQKKHIVEYAKMGGLLLAAFVAGYVIGAYNNPMSTFRHILQEQFHLPELDTATPKK